MVTAVLLIGLLLGTGDGATQEDGCPYWRAVFQGMLVEPLILDLGGRALTLSVKVADTTERWTAGFQCATRDEIARTLILFDFGEEIQTQFHMQHVPAALDIAFARTDGRIFAVLWMAPSETALYGPPGPFRYALEAPAGYFRRQGTRPGEARLVRPLPK